MKENSTRLSIPILKKECFEAKLLHTPKGELVADIGQNIAGLFTLRVHEPKGTRIHLQAGYNYLSPRYEKDKVRYPHRLIIATEPHPFYMHEYWTKTLEASNCIGDFIWTAYDNIGEAGSGKIAYDEKDTGFLGEYPWLSNSQGDFNLDGNRRPQSYYHKILWGMDKGIQLFSYDPMHYGKYSRRTGWKPQENLKDLSCSLRKQPSVQTAWILHL